MPTSPARLEAELRRLDRGPLPGEAPQGFDKISCLARCSPDTAMEVLENAKSVLRCVDEMTLQGWPLNDGQLKKLPGWFVEACAPRRTQAEAEEHMKWWKSLPREEQIRTAREERWTLESWIYFFNPAERIWHWWDAEIDLSGNILVTLEVDEWLCPIGETRWLFRASGAASFDEIE